MSEPKAKPTSERDGEAIESKMFRVMMASENPCGFTMARKLDGGGWLAFSVYDGLWHHKAIDPGCNPVEVER